MTLARTRRLSVVVGLIALVAGLATPVRADPQPGAGVQAPVARWNAIWEPGSDGRPSVHTWTAGDAAWKNGELVGQGYRMMSLTHVDGTGSGAHRYDAIWKPGTEQTPVLIGYSEQQFLDAFSFYWGQGLRLFRMNRYPTYNGSPTFLYDAIFTPGTDGRRVVWGWSLDGLKAEDAKQRAQGYRLIQAAGTNNGTVYSPSITYVGIWAPGTDSRPAIFQATLNEMTQADANHRAAGYRLKYLNVIRENESSLGYYYDAIWEPGSDERPLITGLDYPSFAAKNAELSTAGYRMTISQPYLSPN